MSHLSGFWKEEMFILNKTLFNPLKNRVLNYFLIAHLLFISLYYFIFADSHFLAPDEAGYVSVFQDLYKSDYSYVQWGWPWRTPVLFLRILYSPAKILSLVGMNDTLSLRLLSTIYIYLALYILILAYKQINGTNPPLRLCLILFVPTFFVWSSLGLREPFLYLGLSFLVVGLYFFEKVSLGVGLLFIFVGSIVICFTKDYLFVIVGLCILVSVILWSFFARKLSWRNLALCLIWISPLAIYPPMIQSMNDQISAMLNNDTPPRQNLAGNSTNGESGAWSTERGLIEASKKTDNSLVEGISNLLVPDPKKVSSKKDAESFSEGSWAESKASKLSLVPPSIRKPEKFIPQSLKVMTFPYPLGENGGRVMNLVAWETPLWLICVGFYVFILFKRVKKFKVLALADYFSIIFVIMYVVFMALTEINVGTMIRHKSLIAIPIFFTFLLNYNKISQRLKN